MYFKYVVHVTSITRNKHRSQAVLSQQGLCHEIYFLVHKRSEVFYCKNFNSLVSLKQMQFSGMPLHKRFKHMHPTNHTLTSTPSPQAKFMSYQPPMHMHTHTHRVCSLFSFDLYLFSQQILTAAGKLQSLHPPANAVSCKTRITTHLTRVAQP